MSEVTVKQFAETIGVPVDRLVGQLKDAGISATAADSSIGDDDKVKLLDYLRNKHGSEKSEPEQDTGPKKVTLKRRTTSELKVGGTTNTRGKTVTVEVRKKRTYVKRSVVVADEDKDKSIDGEVDEQLKKQFVVEAEQRAVDDVRRQKEEDTARLRAEKEVMQQAEEEALRKATEEEAARKAAVEAAQAAPAPTPAAPDAKKPDAKKPDAKKPDAKKGGRNDKKGRRKGPGELHVAAGKSGRHKKRKGGKRGRVAVTAEPVHAFEKPVAPVVHDVSIPETITVGELAQKMSVKAEYF